MKSYTWPIVAGVVGIACGLVSNTALLAGQWLNLVVWAIAGMVLGLFAQGRAQIIWMGVVYGFLMSVTFLLSGFQGTPDKLPGFLVLTMALSLVGAMGGLVTVFVGARLRRLFR